mmetsp:Transcript_23954/g.36913  ORF Transcript_23954/g.36913 Transcript_23954/m.36913 type:complete len:370 (+) Transcript_23954:127-1236(+)
MGSGASIIETKPEAGCTDELVVQGSRYDYACTAIDEHRMVIIGGVDIDGFLLSNGAIYDSRTEHSHAWTPLPNDMPTALFDCRAVATETCVLVIGGRGSHGVVNTVYRLSLETYKWTTMASMHVSRALCAAVRVKDFIYVFGGYNCETLVSVERYSIADDVWWALPDSSMAEGRYNHCAVALDSTGYRSACCEIYIVGGCKIYSDVEIFDTVSLRWKKKGVEEKHRIPEGMRRSNAATVVLKDRYLVVVGGYYGDEGSLAASSGCLIYDRLFHRWSKPPSIGSLNMNTARAFHTAAVLGENIVVAGGRNGVYKRLNSMELIDIDDLLEYSPVVYPLPPFHFNQILQIGRPTVAMVNGDETRKTTNDRKG